VGAGQDRAWAVAFEPAEEVADSVFAYLEAGVAHPGGDLIASLAPGGVVDVADDAALRLLANGAERLDEVLHVGGIDREASVEGQRGDSPSTWSVPFSASARMRSTRGATSLASKP